MVNARYTCSSKTTRASSCARVILPMESTKSACRQKSSPNPSAAPMANTSGTGLRSWCSRIKSANPSQESCLPRASSNTNLRLVLRPLRPQSFSRAGSSFAATHSTSAYCRNRFRYSSVRDWIAGLFVFPIHAIVSFTKLVWRGRPARASLLLSALPCWFSSRNPPTRLACQLRRLQFLRRFPKPLQIVILSR